MTDKLFTTISSPLGTNSRRVRGCFGQMSGTPKLVALLPYGAGLWLLEALRLRVKDVNFAMKQIMVRDGKGQKDRLTKLPVAAKPLLLEHLKQVRSIHEEDHLLGGHGGRRFSRRSVMEQTNFPISRNLSLKQLTTDALGS